MLAAYLPRKSRLVIFSQSNANAAAGNVRNTELELRGTKGTMYIENSQWEVVPEVITDTLTGYAGGKGYGNPLNRAGLHGTRKKLIGEKKNPGTKGYDTASHARNFLDCIKTRGKCNADVLTGHMSTSGTLIANIAHKTRSFLEWDSAAERFTNNHAANQLLEYTYRAPYKLA